MRAPLAFWKASAAVFDPATLSLTGWWRASYASAPWAGVASAGASSGRNLSAGTAPSVGTTQNGLAPADFNGTTHRLVNALTCDNFWGSGAGSLWILFLADTAGADQGAGLRVYNQGLVGMDGGGVQFGVNYSTSGVNAFMYDTSATYKEVAVACGTGAYHLAQVKYDGTDLKVRVDSGAWSTLATTTYTPSGGSLVVGKNYGAGFGTDFLDGRILDLGLALTALSDATFDNVKAYCNSRYALAL